MPFFGPIGAVRVGLIDDELVINPTLAESEVESSLDLIVVGTKEGLTMVEAGADQVPEEKLLEALELAHREIVKLCEAQEELQARAGKPKWLDDNVTDPNQLAEIWGQRSNCPNRKQLKEAIYRARPLNGVWATAPYLHNGSVPSLHWMLTPQSERPTRFCMGAREFDPRDVGFRVEGNETSCNHGQTVFSTASRGGKAIKGNSVLGHSFEAAANVDKKDYPDGVIGRLFTAEERLDLIEYLKKL
jgi:hypothetical protein